MLSRLTSRLLVFFPRIKQKLWTLWYQFVSRRFAGAEWTFMNYGYAALGEEPKTLALQERDESDRYCIQLYHHLAQNHINNTSAVLEIGCGRGGGCSYVARYFEAEKVVGVDVSESAVAFCARVHPLANVSFMQGEAERLGCESDSFDAVINVESSHCYPSMECFLAEVFRVLKPGGHFMWADLNTAEKQATMRTRFELAGFTVVKQENITPNVVRSLSLDAERRRKLIARYVPRLLAAWFRDFAGVPGTRLYEDMQSGHTQYCHAVCQKPLAPAPAL